MQLRAVIWLIAGAIALASARQAAHAEKKDAAATPPAQGATGTPASAGIPDAYKLNILIRTSLIALNQANQTGNYSVLRDLGTPNFQAMNTDARLTEIFAALRSRNLDLSPVIFFDPKLVREPAVQPSGLLRLTGYIPTSPERILFDMGFERVGEQWRLSAIVIDVQPVPAAKNETPKATPKSKALPTKTQPTTPTP
jgi:hypothetical protein